MAKSGSITTNEKENHTRIHLMAGAAGRHAATRRGVPLILRHRPTGRKNN